MFMWPDSSTMSEAGTPAAGGATPSGGFGGGGSAGGMGAGAGMQAMNAGEIMLNRAESAALAALETEDDEDHGARRAAAESGLNRQQIATLKARVATAIAKGYTLKGQGFIKKPQAQMPDEPGLTRKAIKPDAPAPTRRVAAPLPAKTKEGASVVRTVKDDDLYTCAEIESYGLPSPQSAGEAEALPGEAHEANTMTTLSGMLSRNRRRRSAV